MPTLPHLLRWTRSPRRFSYDPIDARSHNCRSVLARTTCVIMANGLSCNYIYVTLEINTRCGVWIILSLCFPFYMVSSSKVFVNPFATSFAVMAPSSNNSESSDDGFSIDPASASQIQGISIRHHVPVILDMDEANYGQWRLFFESTLGKFGLQSHVRSTAPDDDRDGEWRMVDACIVNWILSTVHKSVFDIVRRDRHDAFSLWHAVEDLFQDNELQRAVYLEAELRSLQQGDLSMNEYCTKLKRLADQLRDIGHPVSEPS